VVEAVAEAAEAAGPVAARRQVVAG